MPNFYQMKNIYILIFTLIFALNCHAQISRKIDEDWLIEGMLGNVNDIKVPLKTIKPNVSYRVLTSAGDVCFGHIMSSDIIIMTEPNGVIYTFAYYYEYSELKSIWGDLRDNYGDFQDKITNTEGNWYCWHGLTVSMCLCIPNDEYSELIIVVKSRFASEGY